MRNNLKQNGYSNNKSLLIIKTPGCLWLKKSLKKRYYRTIIIYVLDCGATFHMHIIKLIFSHRFFKKFCQMYSNKNTMSSKD